MSRHNLVRVQTYEFKYIRQEASLRVHVELNMRVTLEERNVWSESGQLLYCRMEEPSTPELSDRQHLIIQRKHFPVSPLECLPSLRGYLSSICFSCLLKRNITARKRSLRRLCFYTCLSFCTRGCGGWYPSMHSRWYPSMPCSGSPGGWYPSMPCRSPGGVPGPHPGGS